MTAQERSEGAAAGLTEERARERGTSVERATREGGGSRRSAATNSTLIVVDVQNDFCEGGSLPVAGGAAVAAAISEIYGSYSHVVATRDYHIDPGDHFSSTPDFVNTWPVHCEAGTAGASFHPALDVAGIQAVFSKGAHAAAYSGFEGTSREGTSLADWLRAHDVSEVDIVGIATDHCVRATALDAAKNGFTTRVLLDLTASVAQPTVDKALKEMSAAGITLTGTPNLT